MEYSLRFFFAHAHLFICSLTSIAPKFDRWPKWSPTEFGSSIYDLVGVGMHTINGHVEELIWPYLASMLVKYGALGFVREGTIDLI
jgi:hypothetical protein